MSFSEARSRLRTSCSSLTRSATSARSSATLVLDAIRHLRPEFGDPRLADIGRNRVRRLRGLAEPKLDPGHLPAQRARVGQPVFFLSLRPGSRQQLLPRDDGLRHFRGRLRRDLESEFLPGRGVVGGGEGGLGAFEFRGLVLGGGDGEQDEYDGGAREGTHGDFLLREE